MLYRDNRCLFSDPYKTKTLCGQNVELLSVKLYYLYLKIQSVPHSKHYLGYKNQPLNAV